MPSTCIRQRSRHRAFPRNVIWEAALITPPIGVNLYVVQGIRLRGGPFNDVAYGALPFVVSMLVMVGLPLAYEDLALWLPTLVYR